MLHVEVMYHFNEQVDFKISSKLIQASKGYICMFLCCDMPIQLVLSSEYDDRLEDHFIMY